MSDQGWLIAAAIVLVLMAGWWASAEATLARLSAVGAEQLVGSGRPASRRLRAIFEDLPRYLNILLLLRVICETSATVLVVAAFVHWFGAGWKGFLIALGVMIGVGYLVVGISPVPLGRRGAERVALGAATVLYPLGVILGPVPRLLVAAGSVVTRGRGTAASPLTGKSELRGLVDFLEQRSVIEPGEREMVRSVFELGDTIVR